MADFVFYVDRADRDAILNTLLDGTGLTITPNLNHPTAIPQSFQSVTDELVRCLDVNPVCYLRGEFSVEETKTVRMEKGAYADTYIVAENRGGPLLKLSLVTEKAEADGVRFVPSHLTYPARIWNQECTSLVPQSEALKAAFKGVRGMVMSQCKKLKSPHGVRIGRSAFKTFMAGDASLLINGAVKRIEDMRA